MSEEQLSALIAKLKEDANLRAKLHLASDPDTAIAIAKEMGYEVSEEDWMKYQSNQMTSLRENELESVAGGATQGDFGSCPSVGCDLSPFGCHWTEGADCGH